MSGSRQEKDREFAKAARISREKDHLEMVAFGPSDLPDRSTRRAGQQAPVFVCSAFCFCQVCLEDIRCAPDLACFKACSRGFVSFSKRLFFFGLVVKPLRGLFSDAGFLDILLYTLVWEDQCQLALLDSRAVVGPTRRELPKSELGMAVPGPQLRYGAQAACSTRTPDGSFVGSPQNYAPPIPPQEK